jgi:hypothetical protein
MEFIFDRARALEIHECLERGLLILPQGKHWTPLECLLLAGVAHAQFFMAKRGAADSETHQERWEAALDQLDYDALAGVDAVSGLVQYALRGEFAARIRVLIRLEQEGDAGSPNAFRTIAGRRIELSPESKKR